MKSYYSNCIIVAIKEKLKDPKNIKISCRFDLHKTPFFGIHCWWEKDDKEYHFQADDDVIIGWINFFWHKGSIVCADPCRHCRYLKLDMSYHPCNKCTKDNLLYEKDIKEGR